MGRDRGDATRLADYLIAGVDGRRLDGQVWQGRADEAFTRSSRRIARDKSWERDPGFRWTTASCRLTSSRLMIDRPDGRRGDDEKR